MDTQAVLIDGWGDPTGVRVGPIAVRAPAAGEVTVRVTAAAVGPWDVLTTEGAFAELLGEQKMTFPMVLGWDVAGVVDAAGANADLAVGERVLGMTRQPLTGIGAHAGHVTLPAALCVATPAGVTDSEAATLPCRGLTAYQALGEMGMLAPGSWVLVLGATGQLGGFVTQLAAARGLRVVASVAAAKADAARALGAEAIVDRDDDVAGAVRELVPGGVAAAFDPVGGEPSRAAVAAIRDGGVHVRAVTRWAEPAQERGVVTRTLFVQDDRAALGELAALLADGGLTARVEEVVPLDRAPEAYARLAAASPAGKLVLAP